MVAILQNFQLQCILVIAFISKNSSGFLMLEKTSSFDLFQKKKKSLDTAIEWCQKVPKIVPFFSKKCL